MDVGKGFIGDVGGLHPASSGVRPQGITAARAIESLQAADADNNVAEPIANLGITYQDIAEIAFEILAEYATSPKTITFPDGEGVARVTFMGENGLKGKDGSTVSAPAGTVIISPSRVKVATVPAISYTEEGKKETLKELYGLEAIDKKTLLEGYRFQNVAEIVDRVVAEQKQKAQMPPPPPPVPGDKLITAISSLQKSGTPLTLDVVNEALAKAGLPPLQMAPELPPVAPIDAPAEGATITA